MRWVVDRSDRQWEAFLRTLAQQFEAQGAKLDAVSKKIERAEITAGVFLAIAVALNVFFKDGVWVRVLEALLRFARGE